MRTTSDPLPVRPPPLTPTVTTPVTAGACERDAALEDKTVHAPTVGGAGASATAGKRAELNASDRRALLALLSDAKHRARRPKLCCASCNCSLDDRSGWQHETGAKIMGLDDPFDDFNADKDRMDASAAQRAAEDLFGSFSDEEGQAAADDGKTKAGTDLAGAGSGPTGAVHEEEEETAPARIHLDPGKPTQREVEAHRDESHIPYRLWCPECVAGRGTGEQHRARPDERRIPVFAFDYLLVTRDGRILTREEAKESDSILLKVVVAKDSRSKALFAHAVLHKWVSEDRYAVDCMVQDLSLIHI